ncbi:hypothetical protein PCE1_003025 [Barthelona sp. PCE]
MTEFNFDAVSGVLNVILVLFLEIVAGYFVARKNSKDQNAGLTPKQVDGLNRSVMRYFFPFLFFHSIAPYTLEGVSVKLFVSAVAIDVILMVLIYFMVGKKNQMAAGMTMMAMLFPMILLVAPAVLESIFPGNEVYYKLYPSILTIPGIIIVLPFAHFLCEKSHNENKMLVEGEIAVSSKEVLKKSLKNSYLSTNSIAIYCGVFFSIFGIKLPNWLDLLSYHFARCVIPVGMFVIGLCLQSMKFSMKSIKVPLINVLVKCIVWPVLCMVPIFLFYDGATAEFMQIMLIILASPAALIYFILSQHYDYQRAEAALTIVFGLIAYPIMVLLSFFIPLPSRI